MGLTLNLANVCYKQGERYKKHGCPYEDGVKIDFWDCTEADCSCKPNTVTLVNGCNQKTGIKYNTFGREVQCTQGPGTSVLTSVWFAAGDTTCMNPMYVIGTPTTLCNRDISFSSSVRCNETYITTKTFNDGSCTAGKELTTTYTPTKQCTSANGAYTWRSCGFNAAGTGSVSLMTVLLLVIVFFLKL